MAQVELQLLKSSAAGEGVPDLSEPTGTFAVVTQAGGRNHHMATVGGRPQSGHYDRGSHRPTEEAEGGRGGNFLKTSLHRGVR